MSALEFNGLEGTITGWNSKESRWILQVEFRSELVRKSVKAGNLELVERGAPDGPAAAASGTSAAAASSGSASAGSAAAASGGSVASASADPRVKPGDNQVVLHGRVFTKLKRVGKKSM